MEKEKINWRDAYEVAAVICGINPDSDASTVENAMADKFEMGIEYFEQILQQLFDHIDFGVSPLTQEAFVGFSREEKGQSKAWMLKKDCNQEFIHSVIGWISENKKLTEEKSELVKTITSKGKPIYEVVLRKSTPNKSDCFTMLKDWFKESDDGNNGKMLMAECPNCGDAVVYNDGCVKCNATFDFK